MRWIADKVGSCKLRNSVKLPRIEEHTCLLSNLTETGIGNGGRIFLYLFYRLRVISHEIRRQHIITPARK